MHACIPQSVAAPGADTSELRSEGSGFRLVLVGSFLLDHPRQPALLAAFPADTQL